MTINEHSRLRDAIRITLRHIFKYVSMLYEPIRAPIRRRSIERAGAYQRDDIRTSTLSVLLLMVYRSKNVGLVKILLSQIGDDAEIRLWALDEIAPDLASRTIGCGPGTRFSLINRLYNASPIKSESWVVIADDDVYFLKGDLSATIKVMEHAGFAFAQPSQSTLGWWTDMFSVSRPLVIARDTNYVEQGPLIIADSVFSKMILPLPESDDMGWGIEAEWYRLNEGRLRMGIIDSCRVVHCSKTGTAYPIGPEVKRMDERLFASEIDSLWQLRSVNKYWFKWQRRPPWSTSGA